MQESVTLQTVWWKWNYPRSYEYRWADGAKIKRPIEVSAPKYVEYLMDWIETQLDEETIFPQKLGNWFVWSQRIRALKNCILIILGLCGLTIMWCLVRHCDAKQGRLSLPTSVTSSRRSSSASSGCTRTYTTPTFRWSSSSRKRRISTLASSTSCSSHW